MTATTDPAIWTGRIDGDGPEHARWHQRVRVEEPGGANGNVALLGFACDEGVRRNEGRVGAAAGPDALRRALAPLPLHRSVPISDLGTVGLDGDDLEAGQEALGRAVAAAITTHRLVVVLGGGHETAFGTYLGWSAARPDGRVGILNLDAHFDLRRAQRATSGTPFLQVARAQAAAGRDFRYAVVGISEASNTAVLFETARSLDVPYLRDDECGPTRADQVEAFVADFLDGLDAVHLTIDLDVLPAALAPGVSAPAAFGVPLETVLAVARQVAGTGRLAVVDVVELCPRLDCDGRTARAAARVVHEIVHGLDPR